jgi:hypothetical protein
MVVVAAAPIAEIVKLDMAVGVAGETHFPVPVEQAGKAPEHGAGP